MIYQKPRAKTANIRRITRIILVSSAHTVKQFKQNRLYSFNRTTYEWMGDIIGAVSLFAILFGLMFLSVIWS